jgi:DNA (cytosine-5)-methyltransferase 1
LRTPPTLGATLRSIPVNATHNDEIPRMKKRRQSYNPDDMLCRTILTAPKDHHFHPSGDRRFSIREYAAIQTFPHTFDFEGPYAQKLKQIGNAVPPMFALEMFRHLKSELRAADVAEVRGY